MISGTREGRGGPNRLKGGKKKHVAPPLLRIALQGGDYNTALGSVYTLSNVYILYTHTFSRKKL